MKTIKCEKCEGVGHVTVQNGADDVDQEICDVCSGAGVLEVIAF